METVLKILGLIMLGVLLVIVIALLFTFPTLWLWNWLMPPLFGLTKITFWQALGINILAGMLFKSSNTNFSK